MTPDERKAYDRSRYERKKEKIKQAARDYYAANRDKMRNAQADYSDRNRTDIRTAQRHGISLEAARLLAEAEQLSGDDAVPSTGETKRERVLKDHWRGRIVDDFMHALNTGDFSPFQRSDCALRRILGIKEAGERTPEQTTKAIMRMNVAGSSIRHIAEMLSITKSTVERTISRVEAEIDGDGSFVYSIKY